MDLHNSNEKIKLFWCLLNKYYAVLYISSHLFLDDSVKRVAASSKNLWVSGLAEKTRANDLKALFSKYGKVSLLCIQFYIKHVLWR